MTLDNIDQKHIHKLLAFGDRYGMGKNVKEAVLQEINVKNYENIELEIGKTYHVYFDSDGAQLSLLFSGKLIHIWEKGTKLEDEDLIKKVCFENYKNKPIRVNRFIFEKLSDQSLTCIPESKRSKFSFYIEGDSILDQAFKKDRDDIRQVRSHVNILRHDIKECEYKITKLQTENKVLNTQLQVMCDKYELLIKENLALKVQLKENQAGFKQ